LKISSDMIYDKEILGDVVDDVPAAVPTRRGGIGTNYRGATILHMFLSFSVVSYLSTAQINPGPEESHTATEGVSKGHYLFCVSIKFPCKDFYPFHSCSVDRKTIFRPDPNPLSAAPASWCATSRYAHSQRTDMHSELVFLTDTALRIIPSNLES